MRNEAGNNPLFQLLRDVKLPNFSVGPLYTIRKIRTCRLGKLDKMYIHT